MDVLKDAKIVISNDYVGPDALVRAGELCSPTLPHKARPGGWGTRPYLAVFSCKRSTRPEPDRPMTRSPDHPISSLLHRSFHVHRSRNKREIDVPLLIQLYGLRQIDLPNGTSCSAPAAETQCRLDPANQ
jgi:hypothetical protein